MAHALNPYPAYKDSGHPWLGQIPAHWAQLPGKACYREKKLPNTGLQETTVLSLSYGQIVVKPPDKLHGLVPASFETYQIVDPGDIIIRPTDLQNDWNSLRFGLSRHRGIITSAYMCFHTKDVMTREYGHLLLHTYDLMKVFYGLGSGLRQNLDWTDFKYHLWRIAMIDIAELIRIAQSTPSCLVLSPSGLPTVREPHVLPNDLKDFYHLCGGVILYSQSAYTIKIVSPNDFALANPKIFESFSREELAESKEDISWSWYIVAEGENSQYITIDLDPTRLGRCYDSFWDSYAMAGSSPIVARSFTELLNNLIANKGQHWYWLQPDFESLGDAYD